MNNVIMQRLGIYIVILLDLLRLLNATTPTTFAKTTVLPNGQEIVNSGQKGIRYKTSIQKNNVIVESFSERNQTESSQAENLTSSCILPRLSHVRLKDYNASQSDTFTLSSHTLPADLKVFQVNYSAGSALELSCEDGFRFNNIRSSVVHITCGSDGYWVDPLGNKQLPTCERIGGCSLPHISNGGVLEKATGYMPGDRVPVVCRAGFVPAPRGVIPYAVCKSDGTWGGEGGQPLPYCTELSCGSPDPISNGDYQVLTASTAGLSISNGTFPVDSIIGYFCRDGYKMADSDSAVLICRDGEWSGKMPSCRERQKTEFCESASPILHATLYVFDANMRQIAERRLEKKIPRDGITVQKRRDSGNFSGSEEEENLIEKKLLESENKSVSEEDGEGTEGGSVSVFDDERILEKRFDKLVKALEKNENNSEEALDGAGDPRGGGIRVKRSDSAMRGFSSNLNDDSSSWEKSLDQKQDQRLLKSSRTGVIDLMGDRKEALDVSFLNKTSSVSGIDKNSIDNINSNISDISGNNIITYQDGTMLMYVCDKGYKIAEGEPIVKCVGGEWGGRRPRCVAESGGCPYSPPSIKHGGHSIMDAAGGLVNGRGGLGTGEGARAFYYCNSGYKIVDKGNVSHVMTCTDGMWRGVIPTCVRRTGCDEPMDIRNGNWISTSIVQGDLRVGSRVIYECSPGYRAMGATEIECQTSGYWSDYPPRCLQQDEYCAEPSAPTNGFFMCKPDHCDMFRVYTTVHYVCNRNYESRSGDSMVQTCLPGGVWSGTKPTCVPTAAVYNSALGDSFPVTITTSTVTVVIATSCGVLGLLVLVMTIVAIKRRLKPRGRLCPPVLPSPHPSSLPYGGSTAAMISGSGVMMDEHDRLALIAFADDNRFHGSMQLPSYEEATRSQGASGGFTVGYPGGAESSRNSSIRSCQSREYRSIPRFPGNHHHRGNPSLGSVDHHRNSIVTTVSGARDNLSVAAATVFGSMDTVAASDATSTSVTVDTYDSMASNPSLTASQRAAAGSIESSSTHGSLASHSEGAPLLDPRVTGGDHRAHSVGAGGGGVSDVPFNSDTLCSQTSRTHSESSQPIIEVPEDGRDN